MKSVRLILIILGLSTVLSSCNPPKAQFPIESNFPLEQVFSVSVDEDIERVAVSDTWIAIQTVEKITAIDSTSLEVIWSIPFLAGSTDDSKFQITNNYLIVAANDQIVMIDKDGQQKQLNLNLDGGAIWRLVATYPDYLYVLRGSDWTLEAYDTNQNKFLWKTIVGRGGADVFYDSVKDTAYVLTRDHSVRAFENSTGVVLWETKKSVLLSVFDADVLYLCETRDGDGVYRFSALDVATQNIIWTLDIEQIKKVYKVTLVDNLLIASTRDGLIAIDKSEANIAWHALESEIFFTPPIVLNNVLIAKGASRKVYALSPSTGAVIGFVQLEDSNNIEPSYAARGEVHQVNGGLVFNTKTALFIYKFK